MIGEANIVYIQWQIVGFPDKSGLVWCRPLKWMDDVIAVWYSRILSEVIVWLIMPNGHVNATEFLGLYSDNNRFSSGAEWCLSTSVNRSIQGSDSTYSHNPNKWWPLGTQFSKIWIKMHLSLKKTYFIMSSAKCLPFRPILKELTYLSLEKMAVILQTIFSNAFYRMKKFEFWLKFHWSSFLRVQLTITPHWFRSWFVTK